ncbi:MAG: 4-hydroxy-3-methylbut-2-en-1-yl diphosphate synthase [Bacteroidaceae bacterium]|nr:4-hydroxy-3-methylbut-2-en-1-yl diphosphate synthase [Bacteroidaceae bacterium]
MDIFNYHPRASHEVQIGNRPLGGDAPLRIQSMTTASTNDTEACVEQCKRIMDAGGDYVRLTTQGTIEAENLRNIKTALREAGYDRPLVADVHFNPNVADVAAGGIVEKVRINPGNYVDPARQFKHLEYTDEEYAAELRRLEERFLRLLAICREHGTALRIGVNHGSLSDRIMCRYGDTPEGIVESCMEFLRVCEKENFKNVVVSIKASNTVVMVQSVRLLCAAMEREGMDYPLHLGVTEAGEGEDGRIKSAAGIGALLCDGIGDTLRVSLSEPPEAEIPVAYRLAEYVVRRAGHHLIPGQPAPEFDYLHPRRRPTCAVMNIGGGQVPVVLSARLEGSVEAGALVPDYIYCGRQLPPRDKRIAAAYIVDADMWTGEPETYPAYPANMLMTVAASSAPLKFLFLSYAQLTDEVKACLRAHPEMVVIAQSGHQNRLGELRALVHELWRERIPTPVIFFQHYNHPQAAKEDFQLQAAADMGALLFDGLTDGIFLYNDAPRESTPLPHSVVDETAYAILQATRTRTTKTEYISCPGCGRTLYDLPATIARVKAATAHLTGLKIAIMGCIVNGPGEMADADYGYVGAARGKISLYRGKVCVERNIPAEDAVEKLLALIEADGYGRQE